MRVILGLTQDVGAEQCRLLDVEKDTLWEQAVDRVEGSEAVKRFSNTDRDCNWDQHGP